MKRISAILVLLAAAASAHAQSTSVTINVTDAGSQTWANGTYTALFVGDRNASWPGGALARSFTGALNGSGSATQSLPDNNTINPSPSFWNISVCPNSAVTVTTGCFIRQFFITGSSQTANITPPAIVITVPTTPTQINPVVAYADAEISGGWVGFSYYNVTTAASRVCTAVSGNACTTWAAAGGTPTFPILAPFGSNAAPSYSFSTQSGTGMHDAGGLLTLAVAGAQVLTLSSGGVSVGGTLSMGSTTFQTTQEIAPPTGVSSTGILFEDSSIHNWSFNSNNNGTMSFSGAWNCVNVTPVTVTANVATDQTLMACTIPAGTLNRVGRSLRIIANSIYSTPAASTTAMTIKVKICSVSGCGSGNVLTAATITSGALGTIQVTNNAIQLPLYLTVQTAGAALAVEAHGCMNIDLAASISAADTVFCDNNTATQTGTPSAIDSTAQNFLQITGAFTVASGSNSWSNRQLVAETIN